MHGARSANFCGHPALEDVRGLDDVVVRGDDRVAALCALGLGQEGHRPALARLRLREREIGLEILDAAHGLGFPHVFVTTPGSGPRERSSYRRSNRLGVATDQHTDTERARTEQREWRADAEVAHTGQTGEREERERGDDERRERDAA